MEGVWRDLVVVVVVIAVVGLRIVQHRRRRRQFERAKRERTGIYSEDPRERRKAWTGGAVMAVVLVVVVWFRFQA